MRSALARVGCTLLLGLTITVIATPQASIAAQLVVFISDLHMGIGKTNLPGEGAEEVWSRLEDFRWGQEFDEFLRYIDRESASNTTLVILGDALELWQSSDALCTGTGTSLKCKVNDCEHGSVKVGCTVEEAKRRVQHVVKEHKDVFDSLGAFTKKGRNHLVIVPGNHDAALMLPAVR